ncbi:MAG: nucleotide exchange factor GrpE [Fermentimonas sp.]|jgi:molecular chaperone GrpE
MKQNHNKGKGKSSSDVNLDKEDVLKNAASMDDDLQMDNLAGDDPDDIDTDLEESYEELYEKYESIHDSYLRLNAEFDNFRKRTLKEKAELIKGGGEKVLLGIITLVDDFERALTALHATEDRDSLLEGMDLIYSKFIAFLKQNGVEEIKAIGEPFDADIFEAVTMVPTDDAEQKGKVIDCIQKGYKLNDRIIRFPKVVVGE